MTLAVATAVTATWESAVVGGLERTSAGSVRVVRRCVDLPDLLAVAAAGHVRAAVLSADLRRLDRDALVRLRASGVAVVGLVDPADAQAERRLRQLGVAHVLPADAPPEDVVRAVGAAVSGLARGLEPALERQLADPGAALAAPVADEDESVRFANQADAAGAGRVVAVWGPAGSPGRTTVAITLAAELAALGESALLVDADTYGGCVAQVLGLLDEAPGLAAAARATTAGALELDHLARLAPEVMPGLRVLTGISRSERWPELKPSGLDVVWERARDLARWTVIDCGFSLEQDEEISFDTAAPRRNGATLSALAGADVVLAVGSADPVGLQRLIRSLPDLRDVVPGRIRVVLTRVRDAAVGADAARVVTGALTRYAGVDDAVLVPDDRPACDAAMLAGRTLTEHAPSSPARRALADLAAQVAGRRPARRRRRGLMPALRQAAGAGEAARAGAPAPPTLTR